MYRWRYIKDKLFAVIIVALSMIALAPLFHIIATVFIEGGAIILRSGYNFIASTPPPPLSRITGGIAPALLGSLVLSAISTPLTILIGLISAIFTFEYPGNPLSRAVDTLSRSLASIPTIIVSMTVYTVIVVPSRSFSLFAGAIALTIISLPYAYTSFITSLRTVPRTYKEAALAIGFTRWRSIFSIIVPIAKRAILSGILLTFARAMGETAALLFTIGRNRSTITLNPLEPGDAIPLLIFDFISTPFKSYHEIAWGASLILLLAYLLVFTTSKITLREVRL